MSVLGDFSKAMLRFSWSMSLFSVQQFANLLNLRDPKQGVDEATLALTSVTRAVEEQFGQWTREIFKAGDNLQQQVVDSMFLAFTAGMFDTTKATWRNPEVLQRLAGFKSDPRREEVIVRYTRGTGTFSPDKKYIALRMKIFKVNGEADGYHEGVWEASFQDPRTLLARPTKPQGPMNEPQGPVEHVPVAAHTKAHWVFGDDSSITVVGPASSHLIPLHDGSFLFLVSTAQVITGGTGRYKGAAGLVQSLGSTHVPKGVNLFGPQAVSFEATTFDTFRVVKRSDLLSQPQPSGPAISPDFPYEAKFVNVHGSRMHYIEIGEGEPILFLHGNPTWSYLWRNVIPHLKPLGRCLAPDLIGMGRSDKPAIEYTFFDHARYLERFINMLGLKNITLVVHDWGSALGFHYAMRNQANIKGIAFMEAMLKPYESWEAFPAPLRETFQAFRTPEVGWDLLVNKNVFVEQLLPKSVIRQLSDKEMSYYREPFMDPESRKPIWQFANQLPIAGVPADVAEAVANYNRALMTSTMPKLLIYAEPGAITSAPDVVWCQQNLKNLSSVNIGPGIHFHQEDNPHRIGQELAVWYNRLR